MKLVLHFYANANTTAFFKSRFKYVTTRTAVISSELDLKKW